MNYQGVVLADEKALVGKDLANVYAHFHAIAATPDAATMARFRKKEPLQSMAKSIIKHRVQTLTGRSSAELEEALGFNIKEGKNMSVDQARRLAHLLILEANGELSDAGKVSKPPDAKAGVKRHFEEAEEDAEDHLQKRSCTRSTPRRSVSAAAPSPRPTRGRPSLAEGVLANSLKPKKDTKKNNLAGAIPEEDEEVNGGSGGKDLNLGLDNPTPAMIALKRKSIRVVTNKSAPVVTKVAPKVKKRQSMLHFPGAADSKIFLVNCDPGASLNIDALKTATTTGEVFPGANLTVIHTLTTWQPTDIFNAVRAVRTLNKAAGLESFLVLVGCGLSNVHMFREALQRQTNFVQFVVLDRKDQGDEDTFMLRETSSFFLLGYFFNGCDDTNCAGLPERMVRPGATNVLQAKSVEELENLIVHVFTEEGDWILDVACKSRELSLAAQKTGRSVVALEQDHEALEQLAQKAGAIAAHHNKNFQTDVDGSIIKI